MDENKYIVKKVSVSDTFRQLPLGKPVTFRCQDCTTFSSAQTIIARLNKDAGSDIFSIKTHDNGATYTVLRKA